jgi:xanthine dehydrogenase accessory factor
VRRTVAFSEAIYLGHWEIEGVVARKVENLGAAWDSLMQEELPVLIDPEAAMLKQLQPQVLIDGRMLKRSPDFDLTAAPLVIGLGPGFTAGLDCHAVVETKRGHYLGRVIWQGQAEPNTGIPEPVTGYDVERVVRAPQAGELQEGRPIGDVIEPGETIVRVGEVPVLASFRGALRGLLRDGVEVIEGQKIGDLDPRCDPSFSQFISDKALAVGGGVLEAMLWRGVLPERQDG